MQIKERGKIHNHRRIKQVIDFDGLRWGRWSPTDVDGLMELRDLNAYVLFEFKHRDAEVPEGQREALREMADDFEKAGKRCLLLICEHDVEDCDEDVRAADAMVREYYFGRWYAPRYPITAKKATAAFLDFLS